MPVVLIVGKGPSAVRAPSHVKIQRDAGESVAVVNDAMRLFEGPVDYGFFTDLELIEGCRDQWGRVRQWVCPSRLHRSKVVCDEGLPAGFPEPIRYPYRTANHTQFTKRVQRREICHRSTATAAMSYLAYAGFTTLILIGFDGGNGVAPGVQDFAPTFDYSVFRDAQVALAQVLQSEMGVETLWLN